MSIKKVAFFIIIIFSVIIINNLARSIYSLWQKNHLVTDARTEVEKEKRENDELKRKLAQVQTPEFVEEEARNKLFMAKPGEGVIVLSEKDREATLSAKPKLPDTSQTKTFGKSSLSVLVSVRTVLALVTGLGGDWSVTVSGARKLPTPR